MSNQLVASCHRLLANFDQQALRLTSDPDAVFHSQANAQPLVVQTLVCSPGMQLEPAGSLFFKPTCIGASSQRTLTMHNTARVPLVYQVNWSHAALINHKLCHSELLQSSVHH